MLKSKMFWAALALGSTATFAQKAPKHDFSQQKIQHVLLISIDGMHGIDFTNCAQGVAGFNDGAPFCPNLASLTGNGTVYTDAYTSKPSDSFPGLTAIVTGGTPRTTGVWYDVAYDRALDPPQNTTGNGVAGGVCTAGKPATGTTTEFEEGIDLDQTKVNGGAPKAGLTDGTVASIDPTRLPRDPKNNCAPVWPWQFVRVNTIFGLIHNAGGTASWFDKHPAYSSVAGRDGAGVLDDFYAPEINSNVVPLPGVTTPNGLDCSTVQDPSQTGAWTDSFTNIFCYDTLKVNAIVNQIEGKNHNGQAWTTPTIFGMNFQALSVAEKLIESGVKGGYYDAAATPSQAVYNAISFTDNSIGLFLEKLRERNLIDSTLIVITAKHGQSPIDPNRFYPIPGHSGTNGTSPATLIAALLPWSESPNNPTGIGPTEDDISLLWLADSKNTQSAVSTIEANATQAGLGQIFYGPTVAQIYGRDSRTPDIIVAPNYGVVYTGSKKKQAEHGGFSHDDTNVMLLISNPNLHPRTITSHVEVTQVAPTILHELGIAPYLLDSVSIEGTPLLPGLTFEQ